MSVIPLVGVGLNVSLTPLVGVGLNVSVIPLVGVGLNVNMPLVGVGLYVNAELIVGLLVGNAASQSDSMQKMSTATSIAQTSRFIVLTITGLTADKQAPRIYPSCKDTTMASGISSSHLPYIFVSGRKRKMEAALQ